MSERVIPSPATNPEIQKFLDAANEDKLLIMRCKDTGKHYFYPRARSPFTLSENVEWVQAKGTGKIYSVSVMKAAKPNYAIGYVTLDEGPKLVTNFVDCDFDSLKVDQKVKVVFKTTEDGKQKLPCFTPA